MNTENTFFLLWVMLMVFDILLSSWPTVAMLICSKYCSCGIYYDPSLWLWSIVLEQLLKKQSFINKLSGIRSDDRFDRESWHRGAILWLYFIWHNHRRVVCVWLISELYYYNKDCIGYIKSILSLSLFTLKVRLITIFSIF